MRPKLRTSRIDALIEEVSQDARLKLTRQLRRQLQVNTLKLLRTKACECDGAAVPYAKIRARAVSQSQLRQRFSFIPPSSFILQVASLVV
tara:strand:+ start:1605 stop:1874 length:270 start_codon:yes stop_codon:yes gene_type:complete